MENTLTLQTLIDTLTFSNNIHICVLDMSGMLTGDVLSLNPDNYIHSRKICSKAKLAPRGMRLCFSCKTLSTHKALSTNDMIFGRCPYGIFEAAKSVFVSNRPVCVVFAGNLIDDTGLFIKKTKKCCRLTGGNAEQIIALKDFAEHGASLQTVKNMCEIVCEFIYSHLNRNLPSKSGGEGHYAVNSIINHVNKFYQSSLSLKQMAKLYYLNENYLGRIFKKQTGISFAKYLNHIRMTNACSFLKNTDMSIINIAAACGFNNVTYFNRVFKAATSLTPLEYRRNS